MTKKIKKAIINTTERGHFLPLSSQVDKELFPLGESSIIEILVKEAASVGVEEVVFLSKEKDSRLTNLFTGLDKKLEELKKSGNAQTKEIKKLSKAVEGMSFSFSKSLPKAVSGGHDFVYILSTDLIDNKKNALLQLMDVFKTSERPVVGLLNTEVGNVKTEKIARGLFKFKGFTDESQLKMIGRSVFTSESTKFFKGCETIREAIEKMIDRGHTTYGTKIDGEFFKVENKESYQEANIYYSLKSNKKFQEFIKEKGLL